MVTVLTILVGISMLATLGVLLTGILRMSGTREGSERSNRLMRWRIVLQAVTLVLFAMLLLVMRH